MKKTIALFTLAFSFTLESIAQFKQSMGNALPMDNSIGTIMMDLSTSNKEYLMKGESLEKDTSAHFYPNRVFGADFVYISATNSLSAIGTEFNNYLDATDESTKGQIIATFKPTGGDIIESLKILEKNIESSTMWQRYFKKTKDFVYVQKAPFQLPPNNKLSEADFKAYNKGLKDNFDKYEIRIKVEIETKVMQGYSAEFLQVRSWVQIKESIAITKKEKAKADNEKKQAAKIAFEKREMKDIKNTEAAVIKPSNPGLNKTNDEKALMYYKNRQDSLYNKYESILANYKNYNTADKAKNKAKDLKAAKETLLAYKTNHIQFEAYLAMANLTTVTTYQGKKIEDDGKSWFKGRLIDYELSMAYGFDQIIKTFDLKY
jgi:hypothetical protein